jgi:hypothetical protein
LPELTDFPQAAERKASANSTTTTSSANAARASAAAASPAGGASRGGSGYGHDPRYGWLQGKLEYSPSQKRWKLRYIAVEDVSDDYGGSVILPDSGKLKNFQSGDFVTVHGRVLAAAEKSKGFSPTYGIERIVRQ